MLGESPCPLFDARASSTVKARTSCVGHAGPSFAVGFLRGVAASALMLPDT